MFIPVRLFPLLLVASLWSADIPNEKVKHDILFQVSTLDALSLGIYNGALSFQEVKRHGNFGLGTFDALDGELVVLDGNFFQIRADGRAVRVDEKSLTPFAAVTDFDPDLHISIHQPTTFAQLAALIDQALPSKNLFYAIKVRGRFIEMTARSVARQSKPYPTLAQALQNQQIFNFSHVSGTLVGFRCPDFVKGVNLPGFHFHFLTSDETAGGHALSFVIQEAEVEIDVTAGHSTVLPDNQAFLEATLPVQ